MSKFDWVVVSRMGIGAIQYGPNNTLLHCGQDDTFVLFLKFDFVFILISFPVSGFCLRRYPR